MAWHVMEMNGMTWKGKVIKDMGYHEMTRKDMTHKGMAWHGKKRK
jgi:hypothetical protein